jgi:dTDP-4-dehydrorhamnose 3,5-epimerase
MEIIKTAIRDVVRIKPKVFGDDRGYFFESWNKHTLLQQGFDVEFVQDNQSLSMKGVLRGMHFQRPPYTQGKLVRVIQGSILDVAVDLRKDSPTFLKYETAILSSENKELFYVPEGFAHGFLTLEDNTIVNYKCSERYVKDAEVTFRWDDPAININWKTETPLLSERDKEAPFFNEIDNPF